MRIILIILAAFGFGYGLLQIDKIDPDNYVKMYFGNYMVEIKLLGFILLVLGVVVLLYILLSLFRMLWNSPKVFSRWRGNKNKVKAEQAFGAGYLSLIKGDWKKAEVQLTAKTKYSNVSYVNYLAAAQAAQEQGNVTKRDEYLKLAYEDAPKERLAIGMTKAQLHQKAGQAKESLSTLLDLTREGSKNAQYTAMLVQTYESLGDWDNVQAILPKARKQKALPMEMVDDLQNKYHQNLLLASPDKKAAWAKLPKKQKLELNNIEYYAKYLVSKGEFSQAEKIIRSTLSQNWSDKLVNIYGNLAVDKPAKLLRRVEGWLMARADNAEVLLAAGKLAYASKKIDEAKTYLQSSIREGRLPEAYNALGKLYEADNQAGEALSLYRTGLSQLSSSNELPSPASKSAIDDMTTKEKAASVVEDVAETVSSAGKSVS